MAFNVIQIQFAKKSGEWDKLRYKHVNSMWYFICRATLLNACLNSKTFCTWNYVRFSTQRVFVYIFAITDFIQIRPTREGSKNNSERIKNDGKRDAMLCWVAKNVKFAWIRCISPKLLLRDKKGLHVNTVYLLYWKSI